MYRRTLFASEVRHIIKSHGDPDREAAREQQPVRKSDIVDIVRTIEAADTVLLKGEERGHKPRRLVYTSRVDGMTIECVETIHPARRTVAIKTLRKW